MIVLSPQAVGHKPIKAGKKSKLGKFKNLSRVEGTKKVDLREGHALYSGWNWGGRHAPVRSKIQPNSWLEVYKIYFCAKYRIWSYFNCESPR